VKRTARHGLSRKSKKSGGLVTGSIEYKSNTRPHDRARELKVDIPRGEIMDANYAAAMVAARTGMPLTEVDIVKITQIKPDQVK
jgi:ribosomal protein L20A (L18A)